MRMTYEEARAFLEDCNQYAGKITLDPLREMLRRLGNPQEQLKFIHITGTNGKGSVLAYLSTVLHSAGYQVGRYISPTVFDYRERIQVNEELISREALARLAGQIQKIGRQMLEEGLGHPTMFEAETALAFLYFAEQGCDLVTLECGRGGLTDATNVITSTLLAVFASISLDHIGVLGNTLKEIAENKAGILKPGCEIVSLKQMPEAEKVLLCRAGELGCPIREADTALIENRRRGLFRQYFDYKDWKDVEISLSGEYQFANAALALEAVEALREKGYRISEEAVRRGMASAVWNGRFTVAAKNPLFILDGAHNRDAAGMLRQTIKEYLKGKRLIFIIGVLSDKEYDAVAEQTVPLAAEVITVTTPDNPRALSAEALAETVGKYNSHVRPAKSLSDAVDMAYELAGEKDAILAFGSLSYLGELAQEVQKRRR